MFSIMSSTACKHRVERHVKLRAKLHVQLFVQASCRATFASVMHELQERLHRCATPPSCPCTAAQCRSSCEVRTLQHTGHHALRGDYNTPAIGPALRLADARIMPLSTCTSLSHPSSNCRMQSSTNPIQSKSLSSHAQQFHPTLSRPSAQSPSQLNTTPSLDTASAGPFLTHNGAAHPTPSHPIIPTIPDQPKRADRIASRRTHIPPNRLNLHHPSLTDCECYLQERSSLDECT